MQLLLACAKPALSEDRDSLIYASIRANIVVVDSAHPALQTADALAEVGLYIDATAILREHAASADITMADSLQRVHPQWRFSTGIDYYHLEDIVDTATMTSQELRDYKRLTETPLSIWVHTRATIEPVQEFIDEITPEIYVSERKSRLSASARLALPGWFLRLEPSVKAEKWFRRNAADTVFAPAHSQPSDMGGGAMILTATNTLQKLKIVNWSVPFSVDWEHYRIDQPGYEAFVEWGISPSLEIRPSAVPFGIRISTQTIYENYYRLSTDLLDVVRLSGRLEGFGQTGKINGQISGAWMGERYLNVSTPEAIDRFEGIGRIEYKITEFLKGRHRLKGVYESEKHDALPEVPAFDLHGSELALETGVETAIGEHFRITPELLWKERRSDKEGTRYLWAARSVWEPGAAYGVEFGEI